LYVSGCICVLLANKSYHKDFTETEKLLTWVSSLSKRKRLVAVLEIVLDVSHFMVRCHQIGACNISALLDPVSQ